jgi:hypothetical protein
MKASLRKTALTPTAWYAGMWREVAGQLRVTAEATGIDGFNPLIETLEKRDARDDWDPDQQKPGAVPNNHSHLHGEPRGISDSSRPRKHDDERPPPGSSSLTPLLTSRNSTPWPRSPRR